MTRNLFLLAAMAVLLPSCVSLRPRFTEIRLGMTGPELISVIGRPHEVRESRKKEHGRTEELWEYVFKPGAAETGRGVALRVLTAEVGFFDDPTQDRHYVFRFIDDRLARWGPKKP